MESSKLTILREMVSRSEYIAVDTETNGREIRDGRGYAFGVSLSDGRDSIYLPFRHIMLPHENLDFNEFRGDLQKVLDTKKVIYHNAKFDIVSLGTLGLDARHKTFFDTMILAHLIDENRPYQGKKLDACSKYYCGNEGKKGKEGSDYALALNMWGYEKMSASITEEYAANDALITYELYMKLVPLLKTENLREMWEHKRRFIELLIDMEARGVKVDKDLCRDMTWEGLQRQAQIQHQLNGMLPTSPKDLKVLLIDRLGLPVFNTTPKGKPSFDKRAMQDYDPILERLDNPLAKLVVEYRGWSKSVSSNYVPYIELQSPDGRLRPNYKLHGTVTGRMSCEKPNLQQIPKTTDKPWNGRMKQCFTPEDGYDLVEADYAQLEFRLQAAFAKEQVLIDAFSDPDRDVFDEMAEALGMGRYKAKTLNYTISYGGGKPRVSKVFGVPYEEASDIIDNYYKAYPKLRRTSEYAQLYIKKYGYIPIWTGRRRHFLNPKDDAHKGFNSVCQGGAADLVERSMLRLADRGFNTDDCRMLLQVHDSVAFEIRTDIRDEVSRGIKACMEDVPQPFGVPFKVDCKTWGES